MSKGMTSVYTHLVPNKEYTQNRCFLHQSIIQPDLPMESHIGTMEFPRCITGVHMLSTYLINTNKSRLGDHSLVCMEILVDKLGTRFGRLPFSFTNIKSLAADCGLDATHLSGSDY
jgi:hypothetical protein